MQCAAASLLAPTRPATRSACMLRARPFFSGTCLHLLCRARRTPGHFPRDLWAHALASGHGLPPRPGRGFKRKGRAG